MCGISGIINFDHKPVLDSDLRLMMNKMRHRGPDDEGVFIDGHTGLGFVRLSILDLSIAGHQPMFSNNKRYVIIFNGEVYNYIELRSELNTKYDFRTGTDTEVILAAYQEWGQNCLNKFNGMFAFVIYDRQTRGIFGARDRFGIKPLYYYRDDTKFIFASEIKCILPLIARHEPNNKIIADYLLYNRTDHTDETFFQDIFKLEHGASFELNGNSINFNKWYCLKDKLGEYKHIDPAEYREIFKQSLKLQLRSDVPIGVCLSGGIDSSAIAAALVKDFGLTELNTFSAVYSSSHPSDESYFINQFQPLIKNMHHTYPTADDFYNDFERFIEAHNEPVPDTGPYAQFKVMELATNYVTVTLDGQGADEQLGGYHYFFGSYFVELINRLNFLRLILENWQYLKIHKSLNASKYCLYYLLPEKGQQIVNRNLYPSVNIRPNSSINTSPSINEMLYKPNSLRDSLFQHFEYKLEHLLRWEDLNAMHFSIESRVPFLDHNLVESTLNLPSKDIIKGGVSKYILRESVKDIIPKEIYQRQDKKGFTNPRDEWFRSKKFKVYIKDLIHSKNFAQREYFDVKVAERRYQKHLDRKLDISKEIWKWINLEVWFNKFID